MKLSIYSDLHLEFGGGFALPDYLDTDVVVLAGDIITFKNHQPLKKFLKFWDKPVIFIAGNHEYYAKFPMKIEEAKFIQWLGAHQSNIHFLRDEAITLDGVHFFGGTMWTHFNGGDYSAMEIARVQMNDFRHIKLSEHSRLLPRDTIAFHQRYVEQLLTWFEQDLNGSRVVISHHAPVMNPNTQYSASSLMPAFNSLDMENIIQKYQPKLWIYGHTHECDDQIIGSTRIISNQLGYPNGVGGFECNGFDPFGKGIEVE